MRPAWYSLEHGGWRDYVTLLHPPYTLWHLAYVGIGAGLAPQLDGWRLAATFAAFALAMGVGAHALDELNGRPLATAIPSPVLVALATVSIAAAAGIGIAVAVSFDLWLIAFVVVGSFVVVAYNLELFGGRLHSDGWFALTGGAFPVLTAFFAMAGELRIETVLAAGFAALLSLAQRRLSTPVRALRRRTLAISGALVEQDGVERPLTAEALTEAPEAPLRILTLATALLATALLLRHLR
ncbi:MAG: hypothetical protein ACR2MU_01845 [Gaiellaceae bacterium]